MLLDGAAATELDERLELEANLEEARRREDMIIYLN